MGVRSAMHAVLASQEELTADEERTVSSAQTGRTPCAGVGDRTRVVLSGVVRSVVLRPREGVPALEAELYDGTASVDLVWLGRRRIAGIEPGRRARIEGLVSMVHGRPTIYNPRYELRARPGE
ncbi:OB-fold nucleic acid binding domain-containing protein [Sanguibacter suaedae]|uniref:OB-fold nucleic acid binding domain-containing protein n=1 Tax=Sanguibacter suaedae TaxID=2795737 RepID=A0A934IAI8_9MICO|nr:OB-fold nucleic acid binding domain-containing protein [Sanguibacter suaedae]MBI9114210.1 OB-fold nucleic acid binding domain-containing protein [Sanguibacter suaedae]